MRLHHRLNGPADAPVIALPSSLGTTTELWDGNAGAWMETFRVLRYDQRGHGGSELGLERVVFCGLSLGGATGMWVGAHAPERIDSLVLACTSARFGDPDQWVARAASARTAGVESIADRVIARWFTPAFAEERPDVVSRFRRVLVSTPREGYAGCCEALAGWDFRAHLTEVRPPTLVVAGVNDGATPLAHSRLLAERIPRAMLVVLPRAAHLANVEQNDAFSSLIGEHLTTPLVEVA